MLNDPVSAMMIYETGQQEREAEARMYQFQKSTRGRSGVLELVADLSQDLGGVLAAITAAITGLPRPAGNGDAGQPKAA